MRKLLPLLALLAVPALAAAGDNAPPSPGQRGLWTMLCTQEGVAKGHRNKELDEFVGRCLEAKKSERDRKSESERKDPRDVPAMANC